MGQVQIISFKYSSKWLSLHPNFILKGPARGLRITIRPIKINEFHLMLELGLELGPGFLLDPTNNNKSS